jgi:hypothetical protein
MLLRAGQAASSTVALTRQLTAMKRAILGNWSSGVIGLLKHTAEIKVVGFALVSADFLHSPDDCSGDAK